MDLTICKFAFINGKYTPPLIVLRLGIVIPLIVLLSSFSPSLEDFPEENTDNQYAANFLDHKSVNMNEILCLDVGGDKYRDVHNHEDG